MPVTARYEIELDSLSEILGAPRVLECEPFEWPESTWQILELRITDRTGWKTLTTAAVTDLRALYNGAHGQVDEGPSGLLVQYVQGTGGPAFTVTDWRGNTGQFCLAPDDGLQIEELAAADVGGPGEVGYHTGVLRLVPI
jgi:hypothetical protein